MGKFLFCIYFFIFIPLFYMHAQNTQPNLGFSSCIIEARDGGYALTGKTYTSNFSGEDVYVVKLDGVGNIKWTQTIGGKNDQFGNSIIQTNNGGYAITGATYSSTFTGEDVYAINLDSLGNVKWTQAVGGINDEFGYSIDQTKDGSYIITGASTPLGEENENVYLVKMDSVGNVKWKKTIKGLEYSHGSSIIQTTGFGYAIGGYKEPPTSVNGKPQYDFSIVKLDSAGNVQWNKIIGGAGAKSAYSLIQTKDGGFAVTGTIDSSSTRSKDIYVAKLDAMGNLQWTKNFGGSDEDVGADIVQCDDGGFAITGATKSSGEGGFDVYAAKLDATGKLLWTKTIGGNGDDEGESIVQTTDGGFAIGGFTNVYRTQDYKFYAIKLDASGNVEWTKSIGNDQKN
jgi:hypothetical protein